jgi:hypothetical protein
MAELISESQTTDIAEVDDTSGLVYADGQVSFRNGTGRVPQEHRKGEGR